eukprot:5815839-Amphidinium_carterae.1
MPHARMDYTPFTILANIQQRTKFTKEHIGHALRDRPHWVGNRLPARGDEVAAFPRIHRRGSEEKAACLCASGKKEQGFCRQAT